MKYMTVIFMLLLPFASSAEIHREATVCKESGGICFHWWPELPNVEGWVQDKLNSYNIAANVLVQNGYNFTNSESIIYAKAIYKLRRPEIKHLQQLIDEDMQEFLAKDSTLSIKKISSISTSTGQVLRRYTFLPESQGSWEMVSYGEESDSDENEYFLIFVLSSKSKSGYEKSIHAYEQILSSYK